MASSIAFASTTARVQKFLVDQHLLVMMITAFVFGLSLPAAGVFVSDPESDTVGRVVPYLNVFIVFLISGFRVRTDALLAVVRRPKYLLLGLVLILLYTPLVAHLAVRLPLRPKEFAYGLALFALAPTTVTSGATFVANCPATKEAAELALLLTVGSNLLGCFTVPPQLGLVLSAYESESESSSGSSSGTAGSSTSVTIDVWKLLFRLLLSLFLPTVVGKGVAIMWGAGGAAFRKKWKVPITLVQNGSLVMVVWQAVSRAREDIVELPAEQVLLCALCGVGLHVLFWMLNALAMGVAVPLFVACESGDSAPAQAAQAVVLPTPELSAASYNGKQAPAEALEDVRITTTNDSSTCSSPAVPAADVENLKSTPAGGEEDHGGPAAEWGGSDYSKKPKDVSEAAEQVGDADEEVDAATLASHQQRAVWLLASQKTLPVSFAILAGLPSDTLGAAGLVAIPCVFSHFLQLAMDTVLVDYWKKQCEKEEEKLGADRVVAPAMLTTQDASPAIAAKS